MKYIVTCTKIYNGYMEVEAKTCKEAVEWARDHISKLDDEDNWMFGEATADYAELEIKIK